ncbi:MAG: hypothetical protein ACLTTQ_01230 [Christensenellales bacterium]
MTCILCNADTEAGSIEDVIARAGGGLSNASTCSTFTAEKSSRRRRALRSAFRCALLTIPRDEEADKTVEKIRRRRMWLGFHIREIDGALTVCRL